MQNLIAVFLPLLIDVINQDIKSDRAKFWVSIITSVCAGALLNISQLSKPDAFTAAQFLVSVGLVVGTSQGVYFKYWQNSSLRNKIFNTSPTVENPIAQEPVPAVAEQPVN